MRGSDLKESGEYVGHMPPPCVYKTKGVGYVWTLEPSRIYHRAHVFKTTARSQSMYSVKIMAVRLIVVNCRTKEATRPPSHAMAAFDADFAQALETQITPDAQQGMSPNTASAREDLRMGELGSSQRSGVGETSLALRAMAVASPGHQMEQSWGQRTPEQRQGAEMVMPAVGEDGPVVGQGAQALVMGAVRTGDANMSEAAAWSMEAFGTRRNLPTWVQRIGTFFQEMRSQQAAGPLWPPSPFPSPPTSRVRQRTVASPPSEGAREDALFSREQWRQLQDMEGRAPLLYGGGAGGSSRSGEGSSGESTREAVEAEVRRQMQGILGQLETSRQEASQLRLEVQRLRAASVSGPAEASLSMPPVSGPAAASLSMPPVSGPAATSLSMPPVSGLATTSLSMPPVSGPAATSLSMPPVSGPATTSLSMPPVSGSAVALSMSSVSAAVEGQARATANPFSPTDRPLDLPAGVRRVGFEEVPEGPVGEPEVYGGYLHGGSAKAVAPTTMRPLDVVPRNGNAGVPSRVQGAVGEGTTHPEAPPASQGATKESDSVTKLLEGLERVISGKGSKIQEEVGRVSIEVPKLPEMSDTASVDFGDWLHCLENAMSDISAGSAEWWGLVREAAQTYYDKYQAADQFARIAMKPVASKDLMESRWTRVDRRGASLILGAVPEEIRRELVATRARSTLEVLCRLMVLYRPGSATEKSQLLRRLEEPGSAGSPQEAVELLRHWHRVFQRAGDLSLITPDPSILLKALDGLVRKPLQENSEVTFRMQLLRYHLKVDITPSADGVLAIHRAYLAEFEQLAMRRAPKKGNAQTGDGSSNSPVNPRMKAIGGKTPEAQGGVREGVPQGGQQKPCKFFLTDEGCRRGKSCKFEHIMDKEKRERCWTCGSKQHTSKNCPTKAKTDAPTSSNTTKTGAGSPKRSDGAQETPTIQKVMEAAETLSTATTTVPTSSSSSSVAAEDPVQGVPVDQLLENAHRMMKAFIEGQQKAPTMKAMQCPERNMKDIPSLKKGLDWDTALRSCGVRGEEDDGRMGLLDSGATHALRPATSQSELDGCIKAEVTLAGDQRVKLPQTNSGVILADEAQPIVPLGSLVKSWAMSSCGTARVAVFVMNLARRFRCLQDHRARRFENVTR